MSAGKLVVKAIAGEMWLAMLLMRAREAEEDGGCGDDDDDGGAMAQTAGCSIVDKCAALRLSKCHTQHANGLMRSRWGDG